MQETVNDVMSKKVVAVLPGDTLEEAARLMKEHDVGVLPVVSGGELKGPDTDYQCPGGIIGFDNCSNAGYGSAEIIRPTDVKGKKKPDSSRPYLCFLAEHMNVPPADDAVYYLQE